MRGSGFRVQDSGADAQILPAPSASILVFGSGFGVEGLGLRVQGLGYRVQGVGYRVQGLGCRVLDSGFRVWDLELTL